MIVLDASALVDIVADRPNKNTALDALNGEIFAPAHQLAEVSSAVVRLLRAGELTAREARRALIDAESLIQTTVALDRTQLMRAFELRQSIRVLDGLYVALAEKNHCALVTTDGRLARANAPCDIIYAAAKPGPGHLP